MTASLIVFDEDMKKLPATLVHLQKKELDFAPPVILEATLPLQDKALVPLMEVFVRTDHS